MASTIAGLQLRHLEDQSKLDVPLPSGEQLELTRHLADVGGTSGTSLWLDVPRCAGSPPAGLACARASRGRPLPLAISGLLCLDSFLAISRKLTHKSHPVLMNAIMDCITIKALEIEFNHGMNYLKSNNP